MENFATANRSIASPYISLLGGPVSKPRPPLREVFAGYRLLLAPGRALQIYGYGQAMGLNVFLLFSGFGVGSYLFGEAIRLGFGTDLACSRLHTSSQQSWRSRIREPRISYFYIS